MEFFSISRLLPLRIETETTNSIESCGGKGDGESALSLAAGLFDKTTTAVYLILDMISLACLTATLTSLMAEKMGVEATVARCSQ